MERTEPRDVRALQNYQRPDTSSKIEISKKFDCCEAVSLPESVTSEKMSIKLLKLINNSLRKYKGN